MNLRQKFDNLFLQKTAEVPPPPPLPKYDPEEEAPKWDATRIKWSLPVDKGTVPWTSIGTQPESSDKPDWRGVIKDNVIELPMPEKYTYGQPDPQHYFWFDTPDYADPFKKLGYSAKWFIRSGVFILSCKALVTGMKFTLANNLDLSRRILLPWFLSGMAASLTVVTLANLRGKKDDYYNYAAAGLVMGSILGRKDHVRWFRYTFSLVPAAVIFKHNAEINGQLWPKLNFRAFERAGLAGNDAEHGFFSGDLRFGVRGSYGDPGRDQRRVD